jgi:hypothetical protein
MPDRNTYFINLSNSLNLLFCSVVQKAEMGW